MKIFVKHALFNCVTASLNSLVVNYYRQSQQILRWDTTLKYQFLQEVNISLFRWRH